MTSLYYAYRISLTMVSNIIRETTAAIWNALESIVFIKCEESRWCQVAADFDEKWNFPHCLGAIDGKHVVIQAPKNSGSTFFNYKHSHSIVLLGVADANYCFSIVDIGGRGRESNDRKLPYVFVGDEAFQLTTFMLRPYPGRGVNAHLDRSKQIFNYRLSRARRIIENAFGILVAKWRIFRRPINCEIDTVINIIKATVCLHNFIVKNNTVEYIQPGLVDAEHNGDLVVGEWRRDVDRSCIQDLPQVGSNSYSKTAAHIRNQFAQYFMEEGAIPWQWDRSHN
ncbi:hypothetical protein RN001_014558 [Aquatica leii]|uniref:DDE Tnp4 domain-containing protein n=1 Tax=Aquatica leii TaxID=1421715 RepID=A0AAN7NY66_9COLE|nr:hypothetical protein RN001_014558 [Aquatica leii]